LRVLKRRMRGVMAFESILRVAKSSNMAVATAKSLATRIWRVREGMAGVYTEHFTVSGAASPFRMFDGGEVVADLLALRASLWAVSCRETILQGPMTRFRTPRRPLEGVASDS
jgi:hypothetical protein